MPTLNHPAHESTPRTSGHQKTETSARKLSEVFAENIFSLNAVKEHVAASTYEKMKDVVLKQQKIEPETADRIAEALIKWAMDKGVTHYTPRNYVAIVAHSWICIISLTNSP